VKDGEPVPKVSVIIPAYNAARYLPDALDSVLAQTKDPLEVLVVDDGSSDDTAQVVARYGPPVRYLRQRNAGVSMARNHGIAESRGRYVAFLDADDTWLPAKLDRQLAALKERTECGACYSAYTTVNAELKPVAVSRHDPCWPVLEGLLLCGNVIGTPSTVLVERSVLVRAGGFDAALSYCADWDLWIRLTNLTAFCYVDEPMVRYRQHDTNMSHNVCLLEHDALRVLAKAFATPGLPPDLKARERFGFARIYRVLSGSYLRARRYRDFARCLARALALDVGEAGYMAAFPLRAAARLRRRLIACIMHGLKGVE